LCQQGDPGQGTANPVAIREERIALTEPAAPPTATSTLPLPSANGSAPPPSSAPQAPVRGRLRTRISGMRTGLIIAAVAALIVVLIFIIQNAHAVNISFLSAHLRWPAHWGGSRWARQ